MQKEMENSNGVVESGEMYIPYKCHSSGRIVAARDYAAIHIEFAPLPVPEKIDPKTGRLIFGKPIRSVQYSFNQSSRLEKALITLDEIESSNALRFM